MKKIIILAASCLTLVAKIIVLEPAAVENLLALDAKEQIAAIARPAMLKIKGDDGTLESVGSYIRPNIEKIASLRPSLVIAGHHSVSLENDLKTFGIKVQNMQANSLEQMYENIKILGEISGKKERAKELIAQTKEQINSLKSPELIGKKVLFVFSSNPLMLFCQNNLANSVIKELKMQNVCTQKEQTPIVSAEYILSKKVDFVVLLSGDEKAFLLANPLLKHQKAKIISINGSKMLRASVNITDAISEMTAKMKE